MLKYIVIIFINCMCLNRKQRVNLGLNYFTDLMLEIPFPLFVHYTVGNCCYQALSKIMKFRYISKHTKPKTYTTIIKLIVLHGLKTWTVTDQMESSFKKWKREILRNIYGPKKRLRNLK
jgi:hypothetical protein